METGPKIVQNLEISRTAIEIVRTVRKLTKNWPKEELYGLTNPHLLHATCYRPQGDELKRKD